MCEECEKQQDRAREIIDAAIRMAADKQIPPNHILVVLYEKVKQIEIVMSRIDKDEVAQDESLDPKILKGVALSNIMLKKGVQFDNFGTPKVDPHP